LGGHYRYYDLNLVGTAAYTQIYTHNISSLTYTPSTVPAFSENNANDPLNTNLVYNYTPSFIRFNDPSPNLVGVWPLLIKGALKWTRSSSALGLMSIGSSSVTSGDYPISTFNLTASNFYFEFDTGNSVMLKNDISFNQSTSLSVDTVLHLVVYIDQFGNFFCSTSQGGVSVTLVWLFKYNTLSTTIVYQLGAENSIMSYTPFLASYTWQLTGGILTSNYVSSFNSTYVRLGAPVVIPFPLPIAIGGQLINTVYDGTADLALMYIAVNSTLYSGGQLPMPYTPTSSNLQIYYNRSLNKIQLTKLDQSFTLTTAYDRTTPVYFCLYVGGDAKMYFAISNVSIPNTLDYQFTFSAIPANLSYQLAVLDTALQFIPSTINLGTLTLGTNVSSVVTYDGTNSSLTTNLNLTLAWQKFTTPTSFKYNQTIRVCIRVIASPQPVGFVALILSEQYLEPGQYNNSNDTQRNALNAELTVEIPTSGTNFTYYSNNNSPPYSHGSSGTVSGTSYYLLEISNNVAFYGASNTGIPTILSSFGSISPIQYAFALNINGSMTVDIVNAAATVVSRVNPVWFGNWLSGSDHAGFSATGTGLTTFPSAWSLQSINSNILFSDATTMITIHITLSNAIGTGPIFFLTVTSAYVASTTGVAPPTPYQNGFYYNAANTGLEGQVYKPGGGAETALGYQSTNTNFDLALEIRSNGLMFAGWQGAYTALKGLGGYNWGTNARLHLYWAQCDIIVTTKIVIGTTFSYAP
jgi:hypothetical protein